MLLLKNECLTFAFNVALRNAAASWQTFYCVELATLLIQLQFDAISHTLN